MVSFFRPRLSQTVSSTVEWCVESGQQQFSLLSSLAVQHSRLRKPLVQLGYFEADVFQTELLRPLFYTLRLSYTDKQLITLARKRAFWEPMGH